MYLYTHGSILYIYSSQDAYWPSSDDLLFSLAFRNYVSRIHPEHGELDNDGVLIASGLQHDYLDESTDVHSDVSFLLDTNERIYGVRHF